MIHLMMKDGLKQSDPLLTAYSSGLPSFIFSHTEEENEDSMTTLSGQDNRKSRTHNSVSCSSYPLPSNLVLSRGSSRWGWISLGFGEVRVFSPPVLLDFTMGFSRAKRDKLLLAFTIVVNRWFGERCDKDGFSSFHRDYLKFLFGDDYCNCYRLLNKCGVIDINHSYQVGAKTKSYRAVHDKLIPLNMKNKPLAKKMAVLNHRRFKSVKEEAKAMNREMTVKWMIDVIERRMGLDGRGAAKLIDMMWDGDANLVNQWWWKDKLSDAVTQKEWNNMFYSQLAVKAIDERSFMFSICRRSGRFFSNITNLPRQFRQFLRMDGVRMVDVDIKTAQPYLLSTLYPHREGEWHRFREDIQNYDFYERIAPDVERDKAKHQVYTYVLFGENNVCLRGDMWYMFKTWYPELAEIIHEMKKKDHASVAIHLQKMEADGMIGGVARELAEQEVPFITIHDGLLIKKPQAEKAKQLIVKHFTEITGFEPEVTVK